MFPFHTAFCFSSFISFIFQMTHYSWSFTFYSFIQSIYFYHIILIPNPTQHLSLVLIHFTIFLSFISVIVIFIFSHTMPCSYPLHSLFLLHLTWHKRSYILSQLTFILPSHKSLISFSPFINSGGLGEKQDYCYTFPPEL